MYIVWNKKGLVRSASAESDMLDTSRAAMMKNHGG
jgi:hypothetical protein